MLSAVNAWIVVLIALYLPYNSYGVDWQHFKNHHVVIETLNPRIIGGDEVVPHSYPFQVGLLINGNAFCGGSLISPNYVLTAAHCGVVINEVDVILGAHNITANETTQMHIKGAKVIVHEHFNQTDYQNDIALIKLSESAPINEVIKTVTLPTQADVNKTYYNDLTTAIGWGLAADVDHVPSIKDLSDVLRYVDVKALDNDECGDYYNDEEEGLIYITEKNVCTSGYKDKGTCNGDSGGPLLDNGVQIGLVSIGTNLCEVCSPSIFTKVVKFLDWIADNSDVVIG